MAQRVLFPKVDQGFKELVEHTERLVALYNGILAEGLDRLATLLPEEGSGIPDGPFNLDVSPLEKLAEKCIAHQADYLLDMARVEALDTLGEKNRKAVELLDRHV